MSRTEVKTFCGRDWTFQYDPLQTFVNIGDKWLSTPEDRVTIGRLVNPPRTTFETEKRVDQIRQDTGASTMDWFTLGGTDIVYIKQTELDLATKCLKHPFIIPNTFD